jgi:hypothetical protein
MRMPMMTMDAITIPSLSSKSLAMMVGESERCDIPERTRRVVHFEVAPTDSRGGRDDPHS